MTDSAGCRLRAGLAARPGLALGLIVALALCLAAALVAYRGVGPLGPYATPPRARRSAEAAGDEKTRALIEAINQA